MRSERAGVAGQGQDKPDGDQTVVVISAPGEGRGGRELAGVHATVVEGSSAFCAMRVVDSIAGVMTAKTIISSEIVFHAGKHDMCALLR